MSADAPSEQMRKMVQVVECFLAASKHAHVQLTVDSRAHVCPRANLAGHPPHLYMPPTALPLPRSDISTKAKRCKFCCAPVEPLPPTKSERQLLAAGEGAAVTWEVRSMRSA